MRLSHSFYSASSSNTDSDFISALVAAQDWSQARGSGVPSGAAVHEAASLGFLLHFSLWFFDFFFSIPASFSDCFESWHLLELIIYFFWK